MSIHDQELDNQSRRTHPEVPVVEAYVSREEAQSLSDPDSPGFTDVYGFAARLKRLAQTSK